MLLTLLCVGLPPLAQAAAPASGRVFVLVVNGGGTRADNFRSHLSHVRELVTHFRAAGVPSERIAVMASDGDDPEPDLATRAEPPEAFWLLEGTYLERHLAEPLRYENSTIPGITLLPATRPVLAEWLKRARLRMTAGDTLFFYVTDHGSKDDRNTLGNAITLWGDGKRPSGIDVRGLAGLLAQLPPGLRVLTVMSQCFSGAFAQLATALPRRAAWQGPWCGVFASPADRPAYGCFPEAAGGDRTGHAFTLIDALARQHRLDEVHAEVLLRDQSPDVPLRSSDVFLADRLARAAARGRVPFETFADRWLAQARAGGARHPAAEDLARAEAVARAYDLPGPREIAALGRQLDQLTELRARVGKHQGLWESALTEQTRAHLDDFIYLNILWEPRLRPAALRKLGDAGRRELTEELLGALSALAESKPRLRDLLQELLDRTDETATLSYRIDVREAAWQRVRTLLISAATRAWMGEAPAADRARLQALDACESTALPAAPPAKVTRTPRTPPPLPPLADDQASAARLHPAWLGVAFRPVGPRLRERLQLHAGAAVVTSVVRGSPAAAARLVAGDVVVGAHDSEEHEFERPNQLRAFTMLAPTKAPVRLAILRKGQRKTVAVKLVPVAAGF